MGKQDEGIIQTFAIQDTEDGIRAVVGTIGAALFKLEVPAPDGSLRDVVLGLADPEDYRTNDKFIGATIAPVANRVGGAAFSLNGKHYTMEKNDGNNCLHSGTHALYNRVWEAAAVSGNSVTFSMDCADGENGLPGPLHVDVTYTVQDRALLIDYHGYAEQDTLFNPTNHSYFNLLGHRSGNVLDHELTVYAEAFTPAGPEGVPDGEIRSVEDTPLDFQLSERIGARIGEEDPVLIQAGGYDQNYVLSKEEILREPAYDVHGNAMYLAARLSDPEGDLAMDVFTDLPGMQVYSANYLTGEEPGKDGMQYPPRSAVCLETQYHPNAINVPAFSQPVIRAGKDMYTRTVYRF